MSSIYTERCSPTLPGTETAHQNHNDLLLSIYQYGYYKNIITYPNEERETAMQIYFQEGWEMAKSLLKIFCTKYFTQNVRNKVYRWLNNSISKSMHDINANTCSYKLLHTNFHNILIAMSINEDYLNKWINMNICL